MISFVTRHALGYGAKSVRRKVFRIVAGAAFFAMSWQPVKADPVDILAFGDSLVQGYGLPASDGLVPQLQNWLIGHGLDVRIINAGVAGDTTVGALQRIDWALAPGVDAAIVLLGGNDVLRGYDPALTRDSLGTILGRLQAEEIPVLLIGIAAPGNYGTDYQDAFRLLYDELADEFGVLLYPNFFRVLFAMEDRDQVLRDYYQTDGLHPNAVGVGLIVEDLGPMVEALVQEVED